ncbi:hypothetical protein PGT21_019912 [Puccinia graminis f. sp. tritici]|uniref:NIPA-like protein 2 n=2 Tax=Puccinia graminis f. sp. tritici TaxID=56615 RepID=A0A5B0PTV4_PUCGR|nr:hypothetical protein PGT21_019912 [Puccinia graminis f. sp. tritici]
MPLNSDPSTSTLIGVGISVAGNLLISVALNVQKLAHQRLEPSEPRPAKKPSEATPLMIDEPQELHAPPTDLESPRSGSPASSSSSRAQSYQPNDLAYLSSPLWWLGFVIMSTGELGNFVSYGFAPASVVAPLGTVALVGNCVAAPVLLGERFKKRDWLGIDLVIIGTITIVLSSPRTSEALSPDQLTRAIRQLGFILYAALCLSAILLLICLSSTQWANRFIGIDVGLCAISGGFTVLSTKAFSSLLNVLFLDCFNYSITWIMLAVMLVTAVLQIVFLNRALQRFDSKHVVPVQFVLFTIMAVIGSTILYGDFRDLGSAQVGNFVFACGFIFTGVYMLTREGGPSRENEETADEPRKLRSRCRNSTLTPVPEESIDSSDVVIQPADPSQSFAVGIQDPSSHADTLATKLASPTSWNSRQFSFSPPARRALRRQRSQPILFPRAFGTPGYYLIASSTSRSHGTSHGFPG